LKPTVNPQQWQAEYKAFQQPERFKGAGANPGILNRLTMADLEILPGCELMITDQGDRFKAEPEPEAKCYFQYNGQTRQVILGFEVMANRFLSFDRGVDPETGQQLWGALMGAYEFEKRHDYAVEFPA
jgi:hypothetical protein